MFSVRWYQPSLKLFSSCLLSFLGIFLIARNRPKIKQQDRNFIAMDRIPGKFSISSHHNRVWAYFLLSSMVYWLSSSDSINLLAVTLDLSDCKRLRRWQQGPSNELCCVCSQGEGTQTKCSLRQRLRHTGHWQPNSCVTELAKQTIRRTCSICWDCNLGGFVCACFFHTSVISLFIEINSRHEFKPVPAERQYWWPYWSFFVRNGKYPFEYLVLLLS